MKWTGGSSRRTPGASQLNIKATTGDSTVGRVTTIPARASMTTCQADVLILNMGNGKGILFKISGKLIAER
jgi:hypothetical protein